MRTLIRTMKEQIREMSAGAGPAPDRKSIITVISVVTLMVIVLVVLLPNTPFEFW